MASSTITIRAAPNTDNWRKPPSAERWNSPTAPPADASAARGALPTFASARASFSFDWTEQYDQGGLLLAFTKPGSQAAPGAPPPRWIKTGIEFYNGRPMLSTVACDNWADWSVNPLVLGDAAKAPAQTWTTISIEKESDGDGTSLWFYQVLDSGERVALREVCWVFGDGPDAGWELEVSAYASRPAKDASSELEVLVKDFDVKWEK